MQKHIMEKRFCYLQQAHVLSSQSYIYTHSASISFYEYDCCFTLENKIDGATIIHVGGNSARA